ncbi:MAG: FlgB family protein [Limimaricola sp.]|uniref:FlgB family protein n=1 Tax=Limimaricola sp. TaxID=2211665 RepID=UPI001D5587F7|nr:FlgB family protein [Limimaricola sp.]MBI1417333.1 FlgB family protein [Limimaricola sp.]
MFESLTIFRTAGALANYAGRQEALIARNIANADTPGYRAQTLAPFAAMVDGPTAPQMRATRPGHLAAPEAMTAAAPQDRPTEAAPNGNTVAIEDEMVAASQTAQDHARAMAIYKHALTVLRLSLGR